jgi:hypothetical protein
MSPVADVTEPTMHEDSQETEDANKYLKFSSVILISIVLCLATLCVAVDNTIISTAVPRITSDFHSIDDVGWYAA